MNAGVTPFPILTQSGHHHAKGLLVQVKDFAWSLHWDESLQLPGLLMALEAIDSYCWPDDLAW